MQRSVEVEFILQFITVEVSSHSFIAGNSKYIFSVSYRYRL